MISLRSQSAYQTYEPGRPLSAAFDADKVPMLQMQHLRELDFAITRRISYERTVDEFLLQLATNDALSPLRDRPEMVICLNEEGALIRENGRWELLFTPGHGERLTLAPDAPLYPVLKQLLKDEKAGTVCRLVLPNRSLRTLVYGIAPLSILDEYCKKQPGRYLAVAERIVIGGTEELFSHVPVCRYGSMATVDKEEIENYHTIRALFEDYIYQYDHASGDEAPQPLSVAVFGPPGAGKSFGVKQIARSCGRFSVTSLNLSQYAEPAELFEALGEALRRDRDSIPLVFFDEFDSEAAGVPRGWLKYFLAPMLDGEYTLNGRVCKVGGAVFVFAGATASSFQDFLPKTEEENLQFRKVKGTDFVSRLKGILNIKGPNPTCVTDRSSLIRRALLLRELIIRRAPGIYHEDMGWTNISKSLLSALLSVSEYRHGSRSLEFILAMSRLSDVDRFTPSSLPVDEQLDIHLDVQDFRRKLAFEQIMGDAVEKYAQIQHLKYRERHLAEAVRLGADEAQLEEIRKEPEMAEWNELDEFYKEGHRSQIRYLGERLMSLTEDIGLRPVRPGAADTITELYGPLLEELSEWEHERWMRDKMQDGWRFGKKKDPDLKLSPEMVPFSELDSAVRDVIRTNLRFVPEYLKEIGYELYRKQY